MGLMSKEESCFSRFAQPGFCGRTHQSRGSSCQRERELSAPVEAVSAERRDEASRAEPSASERQVAAMCLPFV